ncbi:MAG: hypothetical protein AAF334_05150 [Pseudomonadota bacterium]
MAVETVVTALCGSREWWMIADNSTFVHKSNAVEIRRVSRDLGVGDVQKENVGKARGWCADHGKVIDAATRSSRSEHR